MPTSKCKLVARAFLLFGNSKFEVDSVVPKAQRNKVLKELKYASKEIWEGGIEVTEEFELRKFKYTLFWSGLWIHMVFDSNVKEETVDDFVYGIHEAAVDTYLEGDVNIYQSGNKEYQVCFDNITFVKRGQTKKYTDYWEVGGKKNTQKHSKTITSNKVTSKNTTSRKNDYCCENTAANTPCKIRVKKPNQKCWRHQKIKKPR